MKSHVASYNRPLYALRIVCTNGTVIRISDFPYDIEISGDTYYSDAGYSFTGIKNGTAMTPGAMDLASLIGISPEFTIPNIQSGIFDRARVYFFVTDWSQPVVDDEPIAKCIFGKVDLEDEKYRTECMTLLDLLNSSVGRSHTASCPLVFGSQGHGQCGVDLAPLTVTGTLTGASDNYSFADSTLTEDDDYFGNGDVFFTTGLNAGTPAQRVKSYTQAGGLIVTSEPFPFPPSIGDEYVMTPGCRKRLVDCRDKWDNVPRRQGFDWIPGSRFLNQVGGT